MTSSPSAVLPRGVGPPLPAWTPWRLFALVPLWIGRVRDCWWEVLVEVLGGSSNGTRQLQGTRLECGGCLCVSHRKLQGLSGLSHARPPRKHHASAGFQRHPNAECYRARHFVVTKKRTRYFSSLRTSLINSFLLLKILVRPS